MSCNRSSYLHHIRRTQLSMCDYTICKHSNNTGNSFPNQSNGPLHTPFWQTKYKGTITCSRRNSLPSVGTCTDLFNRTIPGVSQKDIHRNWNKRLKRGLHLSFYQRNTHAFYNRSHFQRNHSKRTTDRIWHPKINYNSRNNLFCSVGVHDLITCTRINIRTMVRLVVCIQPEPMDLPDNTYSFTSLKRGICHD